MYSEYLGNLGVHGAEMSAVMYKAGVYVCCRLRGGRGKRSTHHPTHRQRKRGYQGHVPPLGSLHISFASPSNSYIMVRTYQKWDSCSHDFQPHHVPMWTDNVYNYALLHCAVLPWLWYYDDSNATAGGSPFNELLLWPSSTPQPRCAGLG